MNECWRGKNLRTCAEDMPALRRSLHPFTNIATSCTAPQSQNDKLNYSSDRGDPSSAFSLSTFFSFSEPLARTVDSLSSAVSRAIGAASDDADFLGSAPSPAPLSEASARRR